ncbi:O-antigen ligase family protein [Parapedobacter luteus]|nr:O-antigen ligase family protein [Parapedobacter luteus]
MAIVIIAITGLALLQKFLPSQISFLTKLYSPEHQSEKLFTTQRVTSIFGNPNTTSLMTCLILSFFLSAMITKGVIGKATTYFFVAMGFMTILLSGSRTGFLAFALLMAIYLFTRTKQKIIVILATIGALLIIYLLRNEILEIIKYFNHYLYLGLKIILNMDIETLVSEGNTFSKRFGTWARALSIFELSPVFGVGPLRGVVTSSTDNFYLYILLRNGLVGLVLYFAFIIYSVRVALKIKNATSVRSPVTLLANAYIFQTAVILFMNFLIEAQIQNVVIYLHLTTLGVLIGMSKQTKFKILNESKKT